MLVYIIRRVITALTVILLALVVSFILFFVAPSDPAGAICGARCTPERVHDITVSLGLDKPATEQVGVYLKGLFVGRDYHSSGVTIHCSAPCLGYSYTQGQPVTLLVGNALPVTVSIVLGAAVVYLFFGILTGTVAARLRGTTVDRAVVAVSLTTGSLPYFVFALLMSLYVFNGEVLPASQYTPLFTNPAAWALGLFGAWATLGISNTATYTRYARGQMIESLGEDYTRTARAKGISERRVVYRHGLRAALTPLATIFGLDLAFQLAGAFFTEYLFGLPGLGLLTIRSFRTFDMPVIMGTVLLGAIFLVAMNLVVDIAYTYLDPRVRLS